MEVIICSTVATAPGQVIVQTDGNQNVDSLISSFCTERGIRHEKEYVLRNIKHEFLPNIRKLHSCGVQNGDVLYLGVRVGSEKWIAGCSQWWLLAGVALIIGAAGLVAISILKVQGNNPPLDYGIVIDAGSSHSQILVYKWEADKNNNTAVAQQLSTCKSKGKGISEYSETPVKAGESLRECLDSAEKIVPDTSYKKTPLFLGATAGMRLLDAANKSASDAIMSSVQETMKTYPFNFTNEQAVILPGKNEGAYGWITVNYVLDNFGEVGILTYLGLRSKAVKKDVAGALDLGGASTQMTFNPENSDTIPEEDRSSLLLYGQKYHIYAHSYLCYGLNEATRKYNALLVKMHNYTRNIEDPCRQTNFSVMIDYSDIFEVPCTKSEKSFIPLDVFTDTSYKFVGTGNSSECFKNLQGIFRFNDSCEDCTFNGVRQPPLTGNFVAFSGYYFTINAFNLTGSFKLADYRQRYSTYCQKPWSATNDSFAADLCIHAHYIDVLLTKGYKFDEKTWQHINFVEKIRNTDIGWSLGFMLNVSNIIPPEYPAPPISTTVFVILVVLFSCFVALAVAFALYAMSANKDRPNNYRTLTDYGSV